MAFASSVSSWEEGEQDRPFGYRFTLIYSKSPFIYRAKRSPARWERPWPLRSPAVVKAAQLLAKDPGLTGEELGAKLRLSASRVARLFKSEMGMSLVEYRNRLRLERFSTLLDQKGDNLLEAALGAGFGSYAQFHRVFSTLRGTTPGKFLRAHAARRK